MLPLRSRILFHYGLSFIYNLFQPDLLGIAGNGVSFLKHEVRWVFTYVKRTAAITPDPCDGDHDCIVNINDSKSYWAYIYVNETLPVVSWAEIPQTEGLWN